MRNYLFLLDKGKEGLRGELLAIRFGKSHILRMNSDTSNPVPPQPDPHREESTNSLWAALKQKRQGPPLWARLLIYGSVISLLVAIAIPYFVKTRLTRSRDACTEGNLKQIQNAVQQWAQENKKKPTDKVTFEDILPYMKGQRLPVCPIGGTYSITTVGEAPTCSSSLGHSI